MGNHDQEEALVNALHTAARWYCISVDPSLMPGSGAEAYENPNGEAERPDVEDIDQERLREYFWHEEFIPALLWEIEQATPDSFQSVTDLRSFLREAGRIAADAVWTRWNGPRYWVAWTRECADDVENLRLLAVERERFEARLTAVLSDDLRDVASLPYRRTLSDEEDDEIWDALHARWPDPALWFLGEYELQHYEHRDIEGVHSFWWWRFAENVPLEALRGSLRGAGVRRVWQVGEDHSCEVDVEAFVPEGVENHFTSVGLYWVIYWDHEGRITIAGDLLTRLLHQAWPSWERYVDEDYATDQICPRCGSEMRMTHGFKPYCPTCSR